MSSLQVWRNVAGVRTNLRVQPTAGFDSRIVYDYECPYGVSVTYGWTAQYTNPGSFTTVFNETWASLAAWTVENGTWNVSAGLLRASGSSPGIKRTATLGRHRVVLGSISTTTFGDEGGFYATNGPVVSLTEGLWIHKRFSESGLRVYAKRGAAVFSDLLTTIDPSAPITIDMLDGSVQISGTGGSVTVPFSMTADTFTFRAFPQAANSVTYGALLVQDYPAPITITETSSAVSLNAVDTWLVHPASPGRSFRVTAKDSTYATLTELGDVSNASNATVHRILGSAMPVTTTTGSRAADETSMKITSYTAQAVTDLMACLSDEVPILVNTPASWDNDLKYAFYQIGQVSRSHVTKSNVYKIRTIDLPLLEVQSPTVVVENAGWSYAALAAEFATYSSILPKFATYADLTSNTRS